MANSVITKSPAADIAGINDDISSLNDSLANLSTDVSTNYATKTELANKVDKHTIQSAQLNGNASYTFTMVNSLAFLIGGRGSVSFLYLFTYWDSGAKVLISNGTNVPTVTKAANSMEITVQNTSSTAMPMIFITRP